jgi:3-phenylpropionate/trans-cinnamate dioxygenase ferredoxin reductase subunit
MGAASTLVIAGASYAGVQLAAAVREQGYDGRIVMVGEETHLPYHRPPLSKGLLTGKTTPEQLALRGDAFYRDNAIELLLGERVDHIDPEARLAVLSDGMRVGYDWLAITTGARCRRLAQPGSELEGVLYLRSLDDALRITEVAARVDSACVIGGGFIGLEVASALAAKGITTTVVEAQDRLLARAVPPVMSQFVADLHRAHGVRVLCGRGIRALSGTGRVEAVELSDGTRVDCGLAVVGIGVVANTELAAQAGLLVSNGIVVDVLGRTSAPHVLAAGDCAAMPCSHSRAPDVPLRLESIQVAADGAKAAASLVCGRDLPCNTVPWFWSDQYNAKLQMAGLADVADEIVLRGNPGSGRFTAFHLRDGCLAAAHSVSRPAEHMLSRKLIAARVKATAHQLADPSFDLQALLAEHRCTA